MDGQFLLIIIIVSKAEQQPANRQVTDELYLGGGVIAGFPWEFVEKMSCRGSLFPLTVSCGGPTRLMLIFVCDDQSICAS